MKSILHISTECYPAAKAGGMGDVVGALPKYIIHEGIEAQVIIPKYKTKWIESQSFKTIQEGEFLMDTENISYRIQQLKKGTLDFTLYVVDIPGKFDREDIYLAPDGNGYPDEPERNMAFQIAIMEWIVKKRKKFNLLHCHDHMTAMIPFLCKHGRRYAKKLKETPVFFTIHNGQYRGAWDWNYERLIPDYDPKHKGLFDWNGMINNLALAIKCAWQVTTVSPSYMRELIQDFDSLTPLIQSEEHKTSGILNGIDIDAWDPHTDQYLNTTLRGDKWDSFKSKNKAELLDLVKLKSRQAIISYIGRLAHQKGVDIMLQGIEEFLASKAKARFILLGTGDKQLEQQILDLADKYPENVAPIISYNEKLSRLIYAGSDFMMMPSRFEPCGLNQMYCMQYGTVPIVRDVGGLKDTVPDISEGGNGIVIPELSAKAITQSLSRATALYKDKKSLKKLRNKIVALDYSWSTSAKQYVDQYKHFLN